MLGAAVRSNRRKIIIRNTGLAFMGMLLLLTFFSKTIYNFSLPEVQCFKPFRSTLSREVSAEGSIIFEDTLKVDSYGPWKVKEVRVEENMPVEKGELLALIDHDSLMMELKKAELAVKELESGLEDYKADAVIETSADAEALRQTEIEAAELEDELSKIKALYESGAESLANVGDAEKKLKAARSRLSLDKVRSEIKNKEYQRNIKLKNLEIEQKKQELSLMGSNVPQDGGIRAPEAGIVRKVSVEKGRVCDPGQTMFEIGGKEEKLAARWELDGKKAILAGAGTKITAVVSLPEPTVLEGEIKGNRLLADEGLYEFTAVLDGGSTQAMLQYGQKVEITVRNESTSYDIVIPNSAIIKESDTAGYVYVLRVRERALGTEEYVEKVNVGILDSDDLNSAVDRLYPDDEVVEYSSGVLEDGEKVRSDPEGRT